MASNSLINVNMYRIVTANAVTGIPEAINISGNITATAPGVFNGDGSGLTNITADGLANGTSNVSIPVANANVYIYSNGVQVMDINHDTGTLETWANITGNVHFSDQLQVAGVSTLGPVGNVIITGGNVGEVLTTDGTGVLSWSTSAEPIANAVIASTNSPTGFDELTKLTGTSISFDNASRTFTIAPTGASFDVWVQGVKYTKTAAESIAIANSDGDHYVYYNNTGTLSNQTGFIDLSLNAPVAIIYWNVSLQAAQLLMDERHGTSMDPVTHEYLHRTRGASISFVPGLGFAITATTSGTGASDVDAQIALSSGTIFDEDIEVAITASATPLPNTWQQDLALPAKIPVLYRSGTAWVLDAPSSFPVKMGATRPVYNSVSGPTWSTTEVGSNKFFVQFICATNNLNNPIISIMGQAQYNTQAAADAVVFGDLQLTGLPTPELRPLYMLTYDTNNGFANAVKARVVAVEDLRLAAAPVAGLTVNGIDTEFRETPTTVFATDATANTAWTNWAANVAVANANYAAYAGNVTIAAQANITSLGTLTGLNVSGVSNLSAVGNVKITGGTVGQVMTTDGTGNLSWTTATSEAPANLLAVNSCVGGEAVPPTGNPNDVVTVGTGGSFATLAAALADSSVTTGTILRMLSNETISATVSVTKSVVIDLNGFTIDSTTANPVSMINVAANNVVIKGGTLTHLKTTNTSVETVVALTGTNNHLVNCVINIQEIGIVARGGYNISGCTFNYVGASLTNSHRYIIVYSTTAESRINNNVYNCSAQQGATRYTNFIYMTSTTGSVFTAALYVTNNTQGTGDLRQFYLQDALFTAAQGASLIFDNNTFNDLNGGIGLVNSASPLNAFTKIVVTNNTQGNSAATNFKGLFYVDGSGTLGTTNLQFANNTTTAGALRVDYTTLVNGSTNLLAYKTTFTAVTLYSVPTVSNALNDTGTLLEQLKSSRVYINTSTGAAIQGTGSTSDPFVLPQQSSTTPTAIVNGTSNVSIPVADGNVNVSVNGVANVVVFNEDVISINDAVTGPIFTFEPVTRTFEVKTDDTATYTRTTPGMLEVALGDGSGGAVALTTLNGSSISVFDALNTPNQPYTLVGTGVVSVQYTSNSAPVLPTNPEHLTAKAYVDARGINVLARGGNVLVVTA